MQRINPYEAPESGDEENVRPITPAKPLTMRQQMVLWTLAVLANIPFCFYMGMAVHGGRGTVGQCLGVLLLIGLGYLLAVKMPWVQRAIRYGSVVTALSQAMPMLQFMAGMLACGITGVAEGDGRPGIPAGDILFIALNIRVMAATVLTGLQVMLVAFAIGAIISAIFRNNIRRNY